MSLPFSSQRSGLSPVTWAAITQHMRATCVKWSPPLPESGESRLHVAAGKYSVHDLRRVMNERADGADVNMFG